MLGGVALRQMDVHPFKVICVRGNLGVRVCDGSGFLLLGLFGTGSGLLCLKVAEIRLCSQLCWLSFIC